MKMSKIKILNSLALMSVILITVSCVDGVSLDGLIGKSTTDQSDKDLVLSSKLIDLYEEPNLNDGAASTIVTDSEPNGGNSFGINDVDRNDDDSTGTSGLDNGGGNSSTGTDGKEGEYVRVTDSDEHVGALDESVESGNELFDGNRLIYREAERIVGLLNTFRAKSQICGKISFPSAGALKWDRRLEQTAIKHSQDMFDVNLVSSLLAGGSSFGDRILEEGYGSKAICAEAIGQGTNVDRMIKEWMKADSQECAKIMNPKFKDVGLYGTSGFWAMELAAEN